MIRKIYLILPKNDRKKVVYLFLFIVTGMFFEVFGIGILLPVLSAILNPETLLQNPLFSSIFTFLKVTNTEELIRISLMALTIIYIVKGIFLLITNYYQNKINSNLIASVSDRLFSKFIRYPYLKHTTENTSDYLKTIQVEVSNFYVFLMAGIYFITETSIIISIVIALLIIEPLGTTVMMIFFFLSSSLFYSISKKLSVRWGKIRESNDKNITKMLLESFGGVKELIITNSFSYFKNKYNQLLTVKADVSTKNLTLNQLPRYYLEVLIVLTFVMFIWSYLRSGYSIENLLVTLGVFVGATLRMLPSINRILSSLQQIKYYQSSVEIIYNELVEQLTDEENEVFSSSGSSLFLENKLRVNKVTFKYPNKSLPVINNISFSISKGTTVGIIGSSGSGKSTLINIIAGLIYPYEGSFRVDDTLVNPENRIAWRNTIGYVSQSTFLSDTSILKNIAYGIDPKEISVERVNQVIDESQLKALVDTLEDGIHTNVGERGVQFSGGQQQRIGIARALYRNPSVLILDEATSALDVNTEAMVMKSIDALKGKKTIIIVTHRLSTLKNCDALYELKEGILVNQKKLILLLKNNSYFRHESAFIDEGCFIGQGTKIWHFSHIMSGAVLGEKCNIGQNVVISPKVALGNNVKVQNNVSIYTGVICEDDVFLGPSMVFTNIINPRSAIIRRDQYVKTLVKKGASIGANATVVCGNTLGAYCLIGAGAVITKDVPDYALVVGNPGKQIGWVSAYGHRLEFDASGQAICLESEENYELKNNNVRRIL